jgi:3-hydroxyisobutyrate dehydrogenase-like beta-hydroxyacid dehydrogenase
MENDVDGRGNDQVHSRDERPVARPAHPMTAARQIGIAGLGLLGSALAHRLLTNGFSPRGYDIDPAKVAAFAGSGGTAATLDEVARCDVVLLAVFDTAQVEDVVENAIRPALTPGAPKTVLCASTCDPDRIAALVAKVAPQLSMIETPVSGSSGQVRNGDGVGLLGGDRDVIDGVVDIIDAIYPKWFYMGPAGNGGRAKLAINHLLGLNRLVLAEGLVFAQALGLDPAAFLDVARQSAAYSQVMDIKGPKMVSGDYTPQGFIHQSLKDFRLILEQAGKRGQDMPLASLNAEVLAACVKAGEGERDNSAVIAEIRRRGRPS